MGRTEINMKIKCFGISCFQVNLTHTKIPMLTRAGFEPLPDPPILPLLEVDIQNTTLATLVDFLSFKIGMTTETRSASTASKDDHLNNTQRASNMQRRYAHTA